MHGSKYRCPHVLCRVVAVKPTRAGEGERVQSVGFGDLVVVLGSEESYCAMRKGTRASDWLTDCKATRVDFIW